MQIFLSAYLLYACMFANYLFVTGMKGCSFSVSSGAALYDVLPKSIVLRSIRRIALLYIVR